MRAGELDTIILQPNRKLTVTTAASSAAHIRRYGAAGTDVLGHYAMVASDEHVYGPYNTAMTFKIQCTAGTATYSDSYSFGLPGISIADDSSVHGNIFSEGVIEGQAYVADDKVLIAHETCFLDADGVYLAPARGAGGSLTQTGAGVDSESTITGFGEWTNTPSYYDLRWYLDDVLLFEDTIDLASTANAVYTYTSAGTGKFGVRARNDYGYTTPTSPGNIDGYENTVDAEGFAISNTFNVA